MSFDLFLARLESGDVAPVDAEAVRNVLRAYDADSPNSFCYYAVPSCDGSYLEFCAEELASGEDFTIVCSTFVAGPGE